MLSPIKASVVCRSRLKAGQFGKPLQKSIEAVDPIHFAGIKLLMYK